MSRKDDREGPFYTDAGCILARLDGYAIVPVDMLERLSEPRT